MRALVVVVKGKVLSEALFDIGGGYRGSHLLLLLLLPPTGMSSPSAEMRMISSLRVRPFFFKLNKNVLGGGVIIDDLGQSEF